MVNPFDTARNIARWREQVTAAERRGSPRSKGIGLPPYRGAAARRSRSLIATPRSACGIGATAMRARGWRSA